MNKQERINFVYKEIRALCEELDNITNQMVVLRPFFENLIEVTNGKESFYKFSEVPQENNIEYKKDAHF